jgi:hypothetical protein
MGILGQDYQQFISPETGEWENEKLVLLKFQRMFEDRIKYVFLAEESYSEPEVS